MVRYEITMQHRKETIQRLARVQYNTFSAKARIFWYGVCTLCIGLGVLGNFNNMGRIVLLGFGGIVFANIGITGRIRGEDTIEAIKRRGGVYPCTVLSFGDQSITVRERGIGNESSSLDYGDIHCLVEDGTYVYLFVSKTAAYMLPLEGQEGFQAFMEEKTGLAFQQPFSFLKYRFRLRRNTI